MHSMPCFFGGQVVSTLKVIVLFLNILFKNVSYQNIELAVPMNLNDYATSNW